MRPYGQRMGANDFDNSDRPVAVVVKARGRRAHSEDYDWLDQPMATEECRDGLERAEPVTGRTCACGAGMGRLVRSCLACRETALRTRLRAKQWRKASPALAPRTCACGIVFALKYEETRCSICRAPERDRADLRARAKRCACGSLFAAKAKQAWCDGCRLAQTLTRQCGVT